MATRSLLSAGVRSLLYNDACGRECSNALASASTRCFSQAAAATAKPGFSLQGLLRDYNKLAKTKLSLLVVATTAAGYVAASGDSVDVRQLTTTCLGTFGCSAAANTLNQIYEIKTDALMRRTMLRPLPAGRMTRMHALAFATVMGAGGIGCLLLEANAKTAALGAANIGLYAAVYTPIKQFHPCNTWIGAVVGAIPPLMGWTAAADTLHPAAFVLPAALYFWQLPHFMALAWMGKEDYSRGGYKMLSLMDHTGRRTAACALRNSLYLIPLGVVAVALGLVHAPFAYESVAVSSVMALSASRFYTAPSQQSARLLFRASLFHLPLFLILYLVHRIPNDGSLDWPALWRQLSGDAEALEARMCRAPLGLPSLNGAMIFPFSPPVITEAPVSMSQTVSSAAARTSAAEQAPRQESDLTRPER